MKNLVIGLLVGFFVGILGSKFLDMQVVHSDTKSVIASNLTDEAKIKTEDEAVKITAGKTEVIEKLATSASSPLISQPQTIEEYQAAYANLQQAIIQQSKAVQKLRAENKKLSNTLEESSGRRVELADLSALDIESAKANIEASLAEASEEYAEVLKAALESYNAGDALPDADALLRHYADEPDFAWSDVARAYIQNYFAAQTDANIQLVQLNCRKTYCEIYGFYSMSEELADPRKAGAQIQSVFRTMEQAPGFSNLFTGLESASISIDSENSYMTFHNFIRSKQQ